MWYVLVGLLLARIAKQVSDDKNKAQVSAAIAKVRNTKCNTI